MPIKMLHQDVQPGHTATFDFGAGTKVLSYVVGLSYWEFEITASGDHHVQILALSLQNNKPDKNLVTSQVTGTLSDDGGHNIDVASSKVIVSCVALVDSDDELTLVNTASIPSGSQSAAINLPGAIQGSNTACLSGFDLRYPGSKDHHVQSVLMTAGFTANGSTGVVTSVAGMKDSSGDIASAAISGGVIAGALTGSGLLMMPLDNRQSQTPILCDFTVPITAAVVLLQHLTVSYPGGNHHVKRIGGGTTDWSVSGSTVTVQNLRAFMKDASSHEQSDGLSNVSVMVVAVPEPVKVNETVGGGN